MIKTIAAVAICLTLAACGTTSQPRPGQITVAYEDTDGTVKYRSLTPNTVSVSGMQSISTYNPFTGGFYK